MSFWKKLVSFFFPKPKEEPKPKSKPKPKRKGKRRRDKRGRFTS
tara:strand:+ start:496 stop:627 length:132 start_codon:yes stop_codon:yes gene_type:complete